jgi:hypothetical protein
MKLSAADKEGREQKIASFKAQGERRGVSPPWKDLPPKQERGNVNDASKTDRGGLTSDHGGLTPRRSPLDFALRSPYQLSPLSA